MAADRTAVRALLRRAGLGSKTPKMAALLARPLDPEIVEAHVLEFLAVREGVVKGGRPYALGLLIRKLEDGDPPPARRCPDCLRLPNINGLCRCDLEAMISR